MLAMFEAKGRIENIFVTVESCVQLWSITLSSSSYKTSGESSATWGKVSASSTRPDQRLRLCRLLRSLVQDCMELDLVHQSLDEESLI